MNSIRRFWGLTLVLPLVAHAWYYPKVQKPIASVKLTASDSTALKKKIDNAWAHWKNTFVVNGVVTDKSGYTSNNGKVSEGVGYGMLLSVLMNDSATFHSIWNAAEQSFWYTKDISGSNDYGWYGWMQNSQSSVGNQYAAPDADEDIALALIFADALIRSGNWNDMSYSGTHKKLSDGTTIAVTKTVDQKAQEVIQSLGSYMVSQGSGFPKPNFLLHSSSAYAQTLNNAPIMLQNPSYFSPAWYGVFIDFMSTKGQVISRDWQPVIDSEYKVIQRQPSYSKGMARDWSLETGASVKLDWMNGSSFNHVTDMWFDAIRVPYRLGMDAYWNKNTNANAYLQNVWTGGVVSASNPGMYTNIDGTPTLGSGYKAMGPRGMWAIAAYAGAGNGVSGANTAFGTLLSAMLNDNEWGTTSQYFDESLALFGALTAFGAYPNYWTLLKPNFKDTSATLTSKLKATSATVTVSGVNYHYDTLKATFSRAVVCSLHAKARPSGATLNVAVLPASTTLNYQWSTLDRDATTFKAGDTVDFSVSLPGWTSVPDSAKTTIRVVSATGIADRHALADARELSWAGSHLMIHGQSLNAGQSYELRLFDPQGRVLSANLMTAQAEGDGVSFLMNRSSVGRGIQILEIRGNGVERQYVLPMVGR